MNGKHVKLVIASALLLSALALFSGCCSRKTCSMLQEQSAQALSQAKAAQESAERALSAAENASVKADAAAESAAQADAAARNAAKSAQKAEAIFMKNTGK